MRSFIGGALARLLTTAGTTGPVRYNYHHPLFGTPLRPAASRRGGHSGITKPNGDRECARRRRQIRNGSLRTENGYRPK